MAQFTADQRLAKVKIAIYGTAANNFNDDQLAFYIDEVIEELVDGGVRRDVAESAAAVGCIAIGVNDLWNYSSGGVKHSPAFEKRLVQLSTKVVKTDDVQTD
jgi:hypothetical protein